MNYFINISNFFFLNSLLIILTLCAARSSNSSDRAFSFLSQSQSLLAVITRSSIKKTDDIQPWTNIVELSDLASLSSGKGVIIAIIDSGIDINNPVFKRVVLYNSWNFADNNNLIFDNNGHGTNVGGIIIKFVPDAKLMVLKINHGNSNTFDAKSVINAINYAVNNGADIINMSLSLANESNDVKDAIHYAVESGVIVVSAAGNNPSALSFPGTVEEVITVGATVPDGNALLWSSPEGSAIDITAPGRYVETVGLDGEIVFVTGTSFSTPMVSGAIASLLGMNQYLESATIETLLFHGARDIGEAGKDKQFGWGVLSGSGISKLATPSITVKKIVSSIETYWALDNSSTADNFEISCYLPPTDVYTDVYIALVKNRDETYINKTDQEYIWWLDSAGIWKGHKNVGIISIASLYIDNKGINVSLFSDSGGIWKKFSSSEFEHGSYKFGIALMRDSELIAPVSWSPVIFF
ncbi:MAG: S8 family serine peptidase [Desulfamplus sp.]|nr:S8 family serine peptidase [Desulfamplus sp.]